MSKITLFILCITSLSVNSSFTGEELSLKLKKEIKSKVLIGIKKIIEKKHPNYKQNSIRNLEIDRSNYGAIFERDPYSSAAAFLNQAFKTNYFEDGVEDHLVANYQIVSVDGHIEDKKSYLKYTTTKKGINIIYKNRIQVEGINPDNNKAFKLTFDFNNQIRD